MERTDREPCPWRIVDDAGGAFVFGKSAVFCIPVFVVLEVTSVVPGVHYFNRTSV